MTLATADRGGLICGECQSATSRTILSCLVGRHLNRSGNGSREPSHLEQVVLKAEKLAELNVRALVWMSQCLRLRLMDIKTSLLLVHRLARIQGHCLFSLIQANAIHNDQHHLFMRSWNNRRDECLHRPIQH